MALLSITRASRSAVSAALIAAALLLPGAGASQAGFPAFTVDDTGDAPDAEAGDGRCATSGGVCTLRAAIQEANVLGDTNEVRFAIPAAQARIVSSGAVFTIQPATVLPAITFPVVLDGRTQPGYSGSPLVHLDGSLLGEGMGLYLQTGDSAIAGLRISGFRDNDATPLQYGAQIFSASGGMNNLFSDNVLGLGPDGLPTGTDIGIWLNANDKAAVTGNALSANALYGAYIASGAANRVSGNIIGLDEAGASPRPNGIYGVFLFGTANAEVGTGGVTPAGEPGRNVISGNGIDGVHVNASPSVRIAGNYIGTDASGAKDMGNGSYGIFIRESPGALITGNVVSGNGSDSLDAGIFVFDPAPAPGPVLDAGAGFGGSLAIRDNLVGTNAACAAAIPNENGLVVLDQPGNERLFWDDVVIDGNTISGNRGTAPAAPAGRLAGTGSDLVAGDGIVWGALLPPGPNGLTISNNRIGSDCGGRPLGNSGDGAILALEPAVNTSAPPGPGSQGGPEVHEFFLALFGVDLSHNGEDCVQADIFHENPPPARVNSSGGLADILGLSAQWQDVTAENCGENGVELNQRMSVLSYTGDSKVTLDQVRANNNGQNGIAINQALVSGGGLPPTDIVLAQANGNEGNGILIDSSADEAFTAPVRRKTTIRAAQADGNGGAGVRFEMLGGGLSQVDVDAPPVVVDDSALTDNGGAGASVVAFTPHVYVPSVLNAQHPLMSVSYAIIRGNGGPGLEVLEAGVNGRASTASRVSGSGTITPNTVIFDNGGPAIDLGGDGPTPNDPLDADAGPNGLTNHPVLVTAAGGDGITITGSYDGTPNTQVELRFYSNRACENGGEGEFYIGRHDIETDGQGHAEFTVEFEARTAGGFVAANATGPEGISEFSECIEGEGLEGISGDTDCDLDVDSVDGLNVLRDVAGFPPSACIGAGNVDCDGDRDSIDALFILRHVGALPVNLPPGCREIGT